MMRRAFGIRLRGVILLYGFAICSVAGAGLCDSLWNRLRGSSEKKQPAPSWRESQVYQRKIGATDVVVVVGNPKNGNMLNQGADVVVDAANGDINPGSGVSGALYVAAGSPDVDKVWRKNKKPWGMGFFNGSQKRLDDGDAWFNTNQDVVAYSPDKGTGAPQNIMRIIHAVAPMCNGQVNDHMRELLVSAYKKSLEAMDWWLRQGGDWLDEWNKQRKAAGVPLRSADYRPTIVFPLLGAGVFGCDPKMVAESFLKAVTEHVAEKKTDIGVVVLAPFNAALQKIALGVVKG